MLLPTSPRKNWIGNSTAQGAVAGSPGTPPTSWIVVSSVIGLSRSIVGSGVAGHIHYVDYRYAGTTSGTEFAVGLTLTTDVPAWVGQVWALSAYLALVGGSLSGVTATRLRLSQRGSGGTNLGGIDGAFTPDAELLRSNVISGLTHASTVFLHPQILMQFTNGVGVDFTLRVGLPQLERDRMTDAIPTFGQSRAVYA